MNRSKAANRYFRRVVLGNSLEADMNGIDAGILAQLAGQDRADAEHDLLRRLAADKADERAIIAAGQLGLVAAEPLIQRHHDAARTLRDWPTVVLAAQALYLIRPDISHVVEIAELLKMKSESDVLETARMVAAQAVETIGPWRCAVEALVDAIIQRPGVVAGLSFDSLKRMFRDDPVLLEILERLGQAMRRRRGDSAFQGSVEQAGGEFMRAVLAHPGLRDGPGRGSSVC